MTEKTLSNRDAAIGCLLMLAILVGGTYGVCAVCSSGSSDKSTATRLEATVPEKIECPMRFPRDFKPVYRLAKVDTGPIRVGAALILPEGLSEQTLRLNLEHALCIMLLELHPRGGPTGQGLAAIWVSGYRAQDTIGHGYTAGNMTLTPYGNFQESTFNMDAPLSEWKTTFTPGSADSYLEGHKQL